MQELKPLTKKQKETLDFIKSFITKNGYSPSLKELAKFLDTNNLSTAQYYVEELEDKGYLKRVSHKNRGIIPTGKAKTIPLMGIIAAGGPIEAIRNPELIEVPLGMLSREANYYALKVSGTSMIEEGISDGDIVIVREQPFVDNGEKAIAYLPDKDAVILKKIYREKDRVKLVPANKTMKSFYEKNIEIQGKVVVVLRKEV